LRFTEYKDQGFISVADLYLTKEEFAEITGSSKDTYKKDIYLGSIQVEGQTPSNRENTDDNQASRNQNLSNF